MSNPVPEDFYYSKGSLNHRRYQNAAYERTFDTFGPDLAGKAPDKSDIPSERPLQTFDRDYWAKEDSSRGLRSLERCPEDELFCILQRKDKKWGLPETMMEEGESLHSAVQRGIVGPGAALDGGAIDTWLITKKPVGTIQQGDVRVSRAILRPVGVLMYPRHSSCVHTSWLENHPWRIPRHGRRGLG